MNGGSQSNPSEELAKAFERNPVFAHMLPAELYGRWLEASWAFLDATANPEAFRECLDRYSYDEGKEFGRLLQVYTDAVEERPFRDVLGELFMRLDANAARNGQVFTPWEIAGLMARMQFSREEFEALAREKGEVSVIDPAVGSGVLLLAFAHLVHAELGRPAVRKLRLYGTDIDRRCVLMCRIQLRMNGLDAFGRLAGLLAAVPRNDPQGEPAEEQTRAAPVAIAQAQAEPALSKAVILQGEEWREEEDHIERQCELF